MLSVLCQNLPPGETYSLAMFILFTYACVIKILFWTMWDWDAFWSLSRTFTKAILKLWPEEMSQFMWNCFLQLWTDVMAKWREVALFPFWGWHFCAPVILVLTSNISHIWTHRWPFILWDFREKWQVTLWPWNSDFQRFMSHSVLFIDACSRFTCPGPCSLVWMTDSKQRKC